MSDTKQAEQKARQVQAIIPQRVGLAEARKRHHVVTVHDTAKNTEDYLDPAFWALVAKDFTVGDTVEIRDDAMTYWGEYLVLGCEPTWAKLQKLREVSLVAVAEQDQISAGYEVKFKGPQLKYCVIRLADKEMVHKESQTREAANDWLRDHLKAMRRAA